MELGHGRAGFEKLFDQRTVDDGLLAARDLRRGMDAFLPEENLAGERFHGLFKIALVLRRQLVDLFLHVGSPDQIARHQRSVAFVDDAQAVDRSDFAQNDLDVLVVDGDALRTVNFLDAVHQVFLHGLLPLDLEQLLRVDVAVGDQGIRFDFIPLFHQNALRSGDTIGNFLHDIAVVGRAFDDDLALALELAHFGHLAVEPCQIGDFFGTTRLEKLFG